MIIFLRPVLLVMVVLGTILTAVALFTPAWRGDMGLVAHNCGNGAGGCGPWWMNQPGWYQTVIVLMVLAFIVELIILAWAALSFLGICPSSLHFPLAFLVGLAAALLIASVATYATGDPNQIIGFSGSGFLGYSFWIAMVAALVMVLATFVACGVASVLSKVTT